MVHFTPNSNKTFGLLIQLRSLATCCMVAILLRTFSLRSQVNIKNQVKFPGLIFTFGVSLVAPIVDSGIVKHSLLSKVRNGEQTNAVLELPSILDSVLTNPLLNLLPGDLKTSVLITILKRLTSITQAPFISTINKLGFAENVESFWIANKLCIKNANLTLVQAFSRLPGQFTLRETKAVTLIRPMTEAEIITNRSNATLEWGIKKIRAPEIWRTMTRGENVIIAGIDTGVLKDHEALKQNYAGGWFDAISGKTEPYDDNGHGTHTMGTIVGQFGIGVAPGAKWIACKALDSNGTGEDTAFTQCAQFVLNFKPTPKVVCNSWGSGNGRTFFNEEIEAWHAAGIIPIFSIGNSGVKGCNSTASPGDQPNVLSVGATDEGDNVEDFSSRGYGFGSLRIKPEVAAPGGDIVSGFHLGTNSYAELDGTSMAAPHVAGAVALMLSANSKLKFNDIVSKLETTAFRPTLASSDLECGAAYGNWPNNMYGYGRINVMKAMA